MRSSIRSCLFKFRDKTSPPPHLTNRQHRYRGDGDIVTVAKSVGGSGNGPLMPAAFLSKLTHVIETSPPPHAFDLSWIRTRCPTTHGYATPRWKPCSRLPPMSTATQATHRTKYSVCAGALRPSKRSTESAQSRLGGSGSTAAPKRRAASVSVSARPSPAQITAPLRCCGMRGSSRLLPATALLLLSTRRLWRTISGYHYPRRHHHHCRRRPRQRLI